MAKFRVFGNNTVAHGGMHLPLKQKICHSCLTTGDASGEDVDCLFCMERSRRHHSQASDLQAIGQEQVKGWDMAYGMGAALEVVGNKCQPFLQGIVGRIVHQEPR